MLTLLLYVLIVGLVAALLFLVASAVFGRGEELGPLPEGTTVTVLPATGIRGADVRALRFQQVFRGYKAGEVDWALSRLAARIDELEAQLAQSSGGTSAGAPTIAAGHTETAPPQSNSTPYNTLGPDSGTTSNFVTGTFPGTPAGPASPGAGFVPPQASAAGTNGFGGAYPPTLAASDAYPFGTAQPASPAATGFGPAPAGPIPASGSGTPSGGPGPSPSPNPNGFDAAHPSAAAVPSANSAAVPPSGTSEFPAPAAPGSAQPGPGSSTAGFGGTAPGIPAVPEPPGLGGPASPGISNTGIPGSGPQGGFTAPSDLGSTGSWAPPPLPGDPNSATGGPR